MARPLAPSAALGIVEGLLWALRGAGLQVSPAQAIVATEAAQAVGLRSREDLREALACVVAHTRDERARFDQAFDAFFSRAVGAASFERGEGGGDLWARLLARGFSDDELAVLRGWMERAAPEGSAGSASFAALVSGGAELEHLLQQAGFRRLVAGLQMELQVGAFQQQALGRLGVPAAYEVLRALRVALVRALGERGDALADALKAELVRAGEQVRARVRASLTAGKPAAANDDVRSTPFPRLSSVEAAQVRAALRRFAVLLEGALGGRLRRAARGRIDPHRTLRRAVATGGVPFALIRRRHAPSLPRLVLLCDVSDSVRDAAGFMLELVQAAHRLFARTRSFVFVSELGETTEAFARLRADDAVAHALGKAVPMHANSNYGRVLVTFEREHLASIDRRTTVVILGDGRTNYLEAAPEVLGRIKARARALYWFSTERREGWASGDSAMLRYAPHCTRVVDVTCARELEEATRLLAFGRRPGR